MKAFHYTSLLITFFLATLCLLPVIARIEKNNNNNVVTNTINFMKEIGVWALSTVKASFSYFHDSSFFNKIHTSSLHELYIFFTDKLLLKVSFIIVIAGKTTSLVNANKGISPLYLTFFLLVIILVPFIFLSLVQGDDFDRMGWNNRGDLIGMIILISLSVQILHLYKLWTFKFFKFIISIFASICTAGMVATAFENAASKSIVMASIMAVSIESIHFAFQTGIETGGKFTFHRNSRLSLTAGLIYSFFTIFTYVGSEVAYMSTFVYALTSNFVWFYSEIELDIFVVDNIFSFKKSLEKKTTVPKSGKNLNQNKQTEKPIRTGKFDSKRKK